MLQGLANCTIGVALEFSFVRRDGEKRYLLGKKESIELASKHDNKIKKMLGDIFYHYKTIETKYDNGSDHGICVIKTSTNLKVLYHNYFQWGKFKKYATEKFNETIAKQIITHNLNEIMKDGRFYGSKLYSIKEYDVEFKIKKLTFKFDKKPPVKMRPSPSESATLFKRGFKKIGNDGNMYVIEEDVNGVRRWKKFNG